MDRGISHAPATLLRHYGLLQLDLFIDDVR